jgi:hypothetical protein
MRASIPPEAAKGEALAVKGYKANVIGREPDLEIGPFAISSIDRDWNKKTSTGIGPWSKESEKRAYRFDVRGENESVHAECLEVGTSNSVGPWGSSDVAFTCDCSGSTSGNAKLAFRDAQGSFTAGDATLRVEAISASESGATSGKPLGFSFSNEQKHGAVDFGAGGRAFLPSLRSSSERANWVCAYAALLLKRK